MEDRFGHSNAKYDGCSSHSIYHSSCTPQSGTPWIASPVGFVAPSSCHSKNVPQYSQHTIDGLCGAPQLGHTVGYFLYTRELPVSGSPSSIQILSLNRYIFWDSCSYTTCPSSRCGFRIDRRLGQTLNSNDIWFLIKLHFYVLLADL